MAYLQVAGNIAQIAHLHAAHRQNVLGHAQLQQLGQLNNQLWLQQQATTFQANINQALFETERTARRVGATMDPDPFAAAVIAHYWMVRVAGLQTASFADVAQKRAWADATGVLEAAFQRARCDAAGHQDGGRYVAALDEWNRLRAPFGDQPDAYLAHAAQASQTAIAKRGKPVLLVQIAGGAIAFAVLALLIGALADIPGLAALGLLIGLAAVGAFGWLLDLWWKARKQAAAAMHVHARAEQEVTAYRSFMGSPHGGVFLEQMWAQHPLLFREPVPQAPGAHSAPQRSVQVYVERQQVERQVVVVRCKFCKQLTPADATGCQYCGAPGFA